MFPDLNSADINYILEFFDNNSNGIDDYVTITPEVVYQCTGLKDKNGKLIYDKDLVKIKVLEDFASFGVNEKYIEITAPIIYENGGFFIEQAENNIFLGQIPMSEIEIIGNICDNPELLEEV